MLSGDSVAGVNDSVPTKSAPNVSVSDGVKSDGIVSDGFVPTEPVQSESESEPESYDVELGLTVRDRTVLPIGDVDLLGVVRGIEERVAVLAGLDTAALSNEDRRALVTRMEAAQRSLFALSHTWIADLVAQRGLDDICGSVPEALAMLLGLSRQRAGQRIRYAHVFGKRTAMTGERLEPELPATAAAAAAGVLDEEHQNIVRKFFRRLGSKVDVETAENAEKQLAQLAQDLLPDHCAVAARRLYDTLDPDGDISDEQIAEQTYFRFGVQDEHGLSKVTGRIDAELRSYLDAAFAKWAKPGMCNPADAVPVVDEPEPDAYIDSNSGVTGGSSGAGGQDDDPDEHGPGDDPDEHGPGDDPDEHGPGDDPDSHSSGGESPDGEGSDTDSPDDADSARADAVARAGRDVRGQGRRQHDALKVIVRQMLASGLLGKHRGLPVTAVVTMSLNDLESSSGWAVTATGSLVRMRDAIRMASHARHYLAIFDDDGRPLYLGRSKRIASEDQRIVLIAADRGCSFPGCTRPATWSQVHHVDEWAHGGNTDIDSLTFGCDQHHSWVGSGEGEWATTKAGRDHAYAGRTLWHAPASVDPSRRGRVNHFHHPNEYIYPAPSATDAVLRPEADATAPDGGVASAGGAAPGGRVSNSTGSNSAGSNSTGSNSAESNRTGLNSTRSGEPDCEGAKAGEGSERGAPPA